MHIAHLKGDSQAQLLVPSFRSLCRLIGTMLTNVRIKIAGRRVYPAAPNVQFASHQPEVIEPPVTDTSRCNHRETTTETVIPNQACRQTDAGT